MSESANNRADFPLNQGHFWCQGTCLTLIRLKSNKNHIFIENLVLLLSFIESFQFFSFSNINGWVHWCKNCLCFQSRNAESDRERYESIKCELKHRSISIIADLNQILWSTQIKLFAFGLNHILLHWRKISQSQTFAPRGRRRLSNLTTVQIKITTLKQIPTVSSWSSTTSYSATNFEFWYLVHSLNYESPVLSSS